MKILSKYLLKSLLYPLVYCLLGFILIFIINDLFDNFSDFLESGIRPLEILYYYGLLLPPMVILILPACLLLAMLYSLSQLTRHSEIVAMRAGGVSIYRIILPFIGVGICATLLSSFLNEKVAPNAGYGADQFLHYQRYGREVDIYFADHIALKTGNHVWMVQRFDTRDYSMFGVELVQQREDGTDAVKINVEKALWLDGRWWFTDLMVQQYNEQGDLMGAPEMTLHKEMRELTETPETFMSEIKDPQHLSSSEIMHYLESKDGISDEARTRLEVDLHSRLATPLTCLAVTLIGIPVGAHTGRKGAFAGIMLAMGLFFTFYALQLVSQYLGKLELIPAWVGGWLPLMIFGAVSPFMIHRLR
jgi:lipopolysaccharide export system permease protein